MYINSQPIIIPLVISIIDSEWSGAFSVSSSARIARSYEIITDLGYRFREETYDPTKVAEIMMRPVGAASGTGAFKTSRHYINLMKNSNAAPTSDI